MLMFPVSTSGYSAWESRSEARIRFELKQKASHGVEVRKSLNVDKPADTSKTV